MTLKEWTDNFADNLTELMGDRNMSQLELSRCSGISVGSISSYVNKQSLPGVKAIINLACALDVDVGDLIDFGDTID
jgi:transcriptional regulator with XRE-family HTH domain